MQSTIVAYGLDGSCVVVKKTKPSVPLLLFRGNDNEQPHFIESDAATVFSNKKDATSAIESTGQKGLTACFIKGWYSVEK